MESEIERERRRHTCTFRDGTPVQGSKRETADDLEQIEWPGFFFFLVLYLFPLMIISIPQRDRLDRQIYYKSRKPSQKNNPKRKAESFF